MIQLTSYGSAVFIADMNFKDDKYVPKWQSIKFINEGTKRYAIKNPDYPYKTKEEENIASWKYENRRRDFIIQFLKEKYPDKDYAKEYEKDNKWNLPLRHHNKQTLKCKYLRKDKHHCNKKRNSTGCYTCCFNCDQVGCTNCECDFIKK